MNSAIQIAAEAARSARAGQIELAGEAARTLGDALLEPQRNYGQDYSRADAFNLAVSGTVGVATGLIEAAFGGPFAVLGARTVSLGVAAVGLGLAALSTNQRTRNQIISAYLDFKEALEVDAVEALEILEQLLETLSREVTDPSVQSMIEDALVEVTITKNELRYERDRARDPGRASPTLRDNPQEIHDLINDRLKDPTNNDGETMQA